MREEADIESPSSNIKGDLIKIVVDKLLVGLILLALGTWASALLEQMRAQESFRSKLNETRVARIGEAWERLYVYESTVDKLLNYSAPKASNREEREARVNRDLQALFAQHDAELAELDDSMYRGRFWLGEETFREIFVYQNILHDLVVLSGGPEEEKFKDLLAERERLRKDVTKVRNALLSGV